MGFLKNHSPRRMEYPERRVPIDVRFWSRVDKTDGCWLWRPAPRTPNGYGSLRIQRNPVRYVLAHRFSYELHHGPIPEGALVCHTCDVKRCVNPAHLYLGDHRTNGRDASERGLLQRGWQKRRGLL